VSCLDDPSRISSCFRPLCTLVVWILRRDSDRQHREPLTPFTQPVRQPSESWSAQYFRYLLVCHFLSGVHVVSRLRALFLSQDIIASRTHCVLLVTWTSNKIFKFYCFTVHFDSLDLIHTNQCTFSYNDVLVFWASIKSI